MTEIKEFTMQDVAKHNTKNDLYLVVHEKVYDCTRFLDEHPGGEEAILDVAGQDATEAFDDVGHSGEAREILDKLIVGTRRRLPGEVGPSRIVANLDQDSSESEPADISSSLYVVVTVGSFLAYIGYNYLWNKTHAQA